MSQLAVLRPRSEAPVAAGVMVHGRGASAEDILGVAQVLGTDRVAFFAPQAPGGSWYPYSFLAPLARNEPYLADALAAVGTAVAAAEEAGVPRERMVILGFSQGACLALEYAARHARRYGGLVAFSGGLIGAADLAGAPSEDKSFDYTGSLAETPVFLGCSDVDPHIPLRRVEQTAEALERLGGVVTKRIYPAMDHTINQDELRFARQLFQAVAG